MLLHYLQTRKSPEPGCQCGRGHHTFIPFAKPAVPVAGNETIHTVANEPWNNFKYTHQPPASAQSCGNLQRGICLVMKPALVVSNNAIGHGSGSLLQQLLHMFALQGGKQESLVRIMAYQPLHRTIAEVANTIEQHEYFIWRGLRYHIRVPALSRCINIRR